MTDISITRFLPTTVSRDKVNSVQTENNDQGHSSLFAGSGEQAQMEEVEALDEVPQEERTNEQQLEVAVARLNDYVQTIQRDIIFGLELGSAEPSVTVVDRDSRKLVRQFGGKEALELAKKLDAQEPITLFKAQV
ncbi:MAG: flagellar protein FlaG [Pseudomonadales bacterium]|nr:flagellar protein FlaG [Pseudomonadales bacterium]MCP5331377.1 flagellar protein FlaG [Pseudomonadales bacterium]MCP5344386.1 flagellar protein FlaG [Pseudomonadales bacterium]